MKVIETSKSTFENLIKTNRLYVDKTEYVYKLVTGPSMVFFSRPRRFGKSMTVSTLEAIFQGKRELFKGLAIDSTPYDWKTYPVIHIDFGSCGKNTPSDLDSWLCTKVVECAQSYSINLTENLGTSEVLFEKLIITLADSIDQVVILIDEYDKVLSDNIYSEEVEGLRTVLGNFYQVIKTQDSKIRFAFITGVTKYAKLSVFSKMNNLQDNSMVKDYACMFGYTQEELEEYFSEYIENGLKKSLLSRQEYLAQLKKKYDGYQFYPNSETVYNPVSIGKFFYEGGDWFKDYWIDTGSTKLLMDIAKKVNFSIIEDVTSPISTSELGAFDIVKIGTNPNIDRLKALLLQTGYLTIKSFVRDDDSLYLDFPNQEVRKGFCQNLITDFYFDGQSQHDTSVLMKKAFYEGKTEMAIKLLKSIYSSIPSIIQNQTEGYYQGILYSVLLVLNVDIRAEVSVYEGRMDLQLRAPARVYVIELKRDQDAQTALTQIKDNHYADEFINNPQGRKIHLLGINFDSKERNISDWQEEII